jgi:hypothetical protein
MVALFEEFNSKGTLLAMNALPTFLQKNGDLPRP